MDSITRRLNGKYEVWVQIQDGNEFCGSFDTEDDARREWVSAVKVLNGMTVCIHQAPETRFEIDPATTIDNRITALERKVRRLERLVQKPRRKASKKLRHKASF